MQVISGNIRGLKLESIKNPEIRPTKDRIKKSLFDILRPKLKNKTFLDLFGGTGQVGIEAFSQGAGKVIIVESSKAHFFVIKRNVSKIKLSKNIEIICSDALNFLDSLKEKIDIIFLDPPYKQIYLLNTSLEKIAHLSFKPEIIVIESLSSENIILNIPNFYLRKKHSYGKIALNLYEKQFLE